MDCGNNESRDEAMSLEAIRRECEDDEVPGTNGQHEAAIYYNALALIDIQYRQFMSALEFGGPDDTPKAIDALIVALNEFKKVLTNT